MKEAEQELERERNALKQRQEDEQRAQKVQDTSLAVDISDTEATSNEGTSSGALESKDN